MKIRAKKAWAIVEKKEPKLDLELIYKNNKDAKLYKGEKWIRGIITPE